MSWHGKDIKRLVADGDDIAFLQEAVGRLMLIEAESVARGVDFGCFQDSLFLLWNEQAYLEGVFYEFIAQHMIHVTMGIEQEFYPQSVGLDELRELPPLIFLGATRINDHAFPRLVIQNVSVFLKGIEDERLYLQHRKLFCQK